MPFWGGRPDPADEGLDDRAKQAFAIEGLFPKDTIKKRGRDAKRQGSESRAHGFFSSGRKVHHDETRAASRRSRGWFS